MTTEQPKEKGLAEMLGTYHTCMGTPQCAACYVDLRARLAEVEKERDEQADALTETRNEMRVTERRRVLSLQLAMQYREQRDDARIRLSAAVETLQIIIGKAEARHMDGIASRPAPLFNLMDEIESQARAFLDSISEKVTR